MTLEDNIKIYLDIKAIVLRLQELSRDINPEKILRSKELLGDLYERVFLLDLYLTGDLINRDPEADIELLYGLILYKNVFLRLSWFDESKGSTGLLLNLKDGTVNVLGDEPVVSKFRELVDESDRFKGI